jgi:hypothetical protein
MVLKQRCRAGSLISLSFWISAFCRVFVIIVEIYEYLVCLFV